MIKFSQKYDEYNLEDAANCFGVPLSKIIFIGYEERNLNEIKFMWENSTLYDLEVEQGLEFGWGKDLSLEEIKEKFSIIYPRSEFISVTENVDPIILINDCLYDGWKRSILAYAFGQISVNCACFTYMHFDNYMYLTEPGTIQSDIQTLKDNGFNFNQEDFNQGIMIYFHNDNDYLNAKLLLKKF